VQFVLPFLLHFFPDAEVGVVAMILLYADHPGAEVVGVAMILFAAHVAAIIKCCIYP
jgi:hypothetical protein